jgi:hypothetical protein
MGGKKTAQKKGEDQKQAHTTHSPSTTCLQNVENREFFLTIFDFYTLNATNSSLGKPPLFPGLPLPSSCAPFRSSGKQVGVKTLRQYSVRTF